MKIAHKICGNLQKKRVLIRTLEVSSLTSNISWNQVGHEHFTSCFFPQHQRHSLILIIFS